MPSSPPIQMEYVSVFPFMNVISPYVRASSMYKSFPNANTSHAFKIFRETKQMLVLPASLKDNGAIIDLTLRFL